LANPEHTAELDGFDRMTVGLYRSGLLVSAVGLGMQSLGWLARGVGAAFPEVVGTHAVDAGRLVVTLGAALSVANLHLYDKRVRWLIGALAWAGALLQLLAPTVPGRAGEVVGYAGLGFVFATLSAFALKEQFCFKLPGLRLVPLVLATSLIPMLFGPDAIAGLLLLIATVIYVLFAIGKMRQPRHFDVGRKDLYQV
jgi:uncharacterized integral membrane protein